MSRQKQIKKEALITILLYVLFFIWWYYFAYIFEKNSPHAYELILGLPKWFFYSCVVGFILFTSIVAIVVKMFFKDIDINREEEDIIE